MLQLIVIILLITSFIIGAQFRSKKKVIHPAYTEARNHALSNTEGFDNADPKKVQRIIAEVDHEGGRITTIIYADGRSMHLETSQAPGKLGNREQPEYVIDAAKNLFEEAQKLLSQAALTTSLEFPVKNAINFHLVTAGGRYLLQSDLVKASNKKHPLHPLYQGLADYNKELAAAENSRKYSSGSQYVVIED